MEQSTCTSCGAVNPPDASFCTACGHAFSPAEPEPQVEYLLGEPPAGGEPTSTGSTGSTGSGRTIGLIALVAVVVLALAGTGLFFLLKESDEDKVEATVRSYVQAVDDSDCDALVDLIQLEGVSDEELRSECEDTGAGDDVKVHEVSVSKVDVADGGKKASARLKVTYTDEDGRDSDTETVLLEKNDGDWEITGFED